MSNLAVKENLNSENQEIEEMLDSSLPKKNIDIMMDMMKQLVIYQKSEINWEDLVEMEELEEGEILLDSNKAMVQEEAQNLHVIEDHNTSPILLETSLCKEIVLFKNDFDFEEKKEEGKDLKQKLNQRKNLEKKNNIVPKRVETHSSKLEQQTKVKPNVGTPEKPRRKSTRKTREMESM